MSEEWLYKITLEKIAQVHSLTLDKIYDFTQKIYLDKINIKGTDSLQIDIVAADCRRKIIVFSECKQYLTFQAVSECAEQLMLKKYLLQHYKKNGALGNQRKMIPINELKDYQFIQYISVGSYSGKGYQNAKCFSTSELIPRLKSYRQYLIYTNRGYMGLILFLDKKDTKPALYKAQKQKWLA